MTALEMRIGNQALWMSLNFSREEINLPLWSIPDNKAPRIDGYNSKFYKAVWSVIGYDIVHAIQDFFRNDKMLNSWNITSITLVPKTSCPASPGDFRPIFCCHVLYKCVAKLICTRLRLVLTSIISPNQGGFVVGRSISPILCSAKILSSIIQGKIVHLVA